MSNSRNVLLAPQDRQGNPVSLVSPEIREDRDSPEHQDKQGHHARIRQQLVNDALQVLPDSPEIRDPRDIPDSQANQEHQHMEVDKVRPDLQDHREHLVNLASPEDPDKTVRPDSLALHPPPCPDLKDRLARPEHPETLADLANPETLADRASQGLADRRDTRDNPVVLANLVSQGQPDSRAAMPLTVPALLAVVLRLLLLLRPTTRLLPRDRPLLISTRRRLEQQQANNSTCQITITTTS